MNSLTILNRMKLRGQSENGYAMAVLLVAMGVMADHDDRRDAGLEADGAARKRAGARSSEVSNTPAPSGFSSASTPTRRRPRSMCSSRSISSARNTKTRSPTPTSSRFPPAGGAAATGRRAGAAPGACACGPRRVDATPIGGSPVGSAGGARRHHRRDEREQGAVDSHLQRRDPLQRVAIRLRASRRRRLGPEPPGDRRSRSTRAASQVQADR